MDTIQLQKDLKEAIINELDLCEYSDVPIVFNMIQDSSFKELLVKEITKRVIMTRKNICDIIVQIDNEYNPNTLD
jgi:hypothetical protein